MTRTAPSLPIPLPPTIGPMTDRQHGPARIGVAKHIRYPTADADLVTAWALENGVTEAEQYRLVVEAGLHALANQADPAKARRVLKRANSLAAARKQGA